MLINNHFKHLESDYVFSTFIVLNTLQFALTIACNVILTKLDNHPRHYF